MSETEGVNSGTWKIEPGTQFSLDGADEIAVIFHECNMPIYVKRDELPDLLGGLMLYLGVEKIEAS